jgi:hypothetical protein
MSMEGSWGYRDSPSQRPLKLLIRRTLKAVGQGSVEQVV